LTVFDVPAAALINAVATDLRKQGIETPAWAIFVKTGQHKERAPDSPEWFSERMASILYRIYKQGPLGTEALRTYYGGRKRRGVRKACFRKASGKIVRVCLQQLEKHGLVKKDKKGRAITGKGQSYLNRLSKTAMAVAREEEKRKLEAKPEKKEEAKKKEKRKEEKKEAAKKEES